MDSPAHLQLQTVNQRKSLGLQQILLLMSLTGTRTWGKKEAKSSSVENFSRIVTSN